MTHDECICWKTTQSEKSKYVDAEGEEEEEEETETTRGEQQQLRGRREGVFAASVSVHLGSAVC